MCLKTFDKAPAIFKKMQKGKLNLTEQTLTEGQVQALAEAASHFDNFVDQIKFENNSLTDENLSQIIKKLTVLPKLKQLAIS